MTAAQPTRPKVSRTQPPPGAAPRPRRRARTATVSNGSIKRAMAAVAAASALLLAVYIGEYASVAKTNRQKSAVRVELRRARQENSNLRAQVKILERPARIDDVARKIGMEQRVEAEYVALAPLPPPTDETKEAKPILAGFLPEGWTNLLARSR